MIHIARLARHIVVYCTTDTIVCGHMLAATFFLRNLLQKLGAPILTIPGTMSNFLLAFVCKPRPYFLPEMGVRL